MKYLVIFLYIYSTYLFADTTFLQKTSAQEMFELSKKEWTTNLQALEENGLANYKNLTMIMRTNPGTGLLLVTPVYLKENSRPIQIHVSIIGDEQPATMLYNNMRINDADEMIKDAVKEMLPEYTSFGYLVRNKNEVPSLHFIILEKNKFPEMDKLYEIGIYCPKSQCIQTKYLEGPHIIKNFL